MVTFKKTGYFLCTNLLIIHFLSSESHDCTHIRQYLGIFISVVLFCIEDKVSIYQGLERTRAVLLKQGPWANFSKRSPRLNSQDSFSFIMIDKIAFALFSTQRINVEPNLEQHPISRKFISVVLNKWVAGTYIWITKTYAIVVFQKLTNCAWSCFVNHWC